MNQVALLALVYFGWWALVGLLFLTRRWLRRRRARRRVPVAELLARIERERTTQPTDRLSPRNPSLPPGWCWPSRDHDSSPPQRLDQRW